MEGRTNGAGGSSVEEVADGLEVEVLLKIFDFDGLGGMVANI